MDAIFSKVREAKNLELTNLYCNLTHKMRGTNAPHEPCSRFAQFLISYNKMSVACSKQDHDHTTILIAMIQGMSKESFSNGLSGSEMKSIATVYFIRPCCATNQVPRFVTF